MKRNESATKWEARAARAARAELRATSPTVKRTHNIEDTKNVYETTPKSPRSQNGTIAEMPFNSSHDAIISLFFILNYSTIQANI